MAEFVISTQSLPQPHSGLAQSSDSSVFMYDRSKPCAKWNLVHCYTYPQALLLGIVPLNQVCHLSSHLPFNHPGALSDLVADVLFWSPNPLRLNFSLTYSCQAHVTIKAFSETNSITATSQTPPQDPGALTLCRNRP